MPNLNQQQTVPSGEGYIKHLESNLQDLIQLLVDPSLWNFLSEMERHKVSNILQRQYQP